MSARRAGQNKAVNHVLITASPEYQQKVFLFDNLVDALGKDPRVGLNQTAMDRLGRSKALVNAESTALFDPRLNAIAEFYKKYPDLEGAPLKDALKLATSPILTQDSQFRLVRGWHGGEVHHNVGVGGISQQTSALPYQQWGTALQGAGSQIPITTQVFNGTGNRSGPGHNLSHLDLVSGLFNKGEGAGSFPLILPGGTHEDQVAEIVDAAKSMNVISQLGAAADDRLFVPVLADLMSQKSGRKVDPSELSSTYVSPLGRGASEASIAYDLSTPEMVAEATKEAFGTDHAVEGATKYLNTHSAVSPLASVDELKARKNAKARAARKAKKMGLPTPSETKQSPITIRPDHGEMANLLGVNTRKHIFV